MSQCPRCGALLPSEPQSFCPNCGGALLATPPPLPAAPPVFGASAPRAAAAGSTPWERRAEIGFIPGLVETTKQVLVGPSEFFRRMPVDAGLGAPLGYAMIVGYVGIVVSSIYQAAIRAGLGSTLYEFGHRGPFGRVAPFLEGGVGLVAQLILGPVFLLLALFLGAGIHHLVLLLLGMAKRGFEATFRISCYSQAVSVLLLLPICGGVISFFWWLAVAIIGLAEAHGIGRGSAAIAVLAPLVLICCCCGLLGALFFGGLATALHHAR